MPVEHLLFRYCPSIRLQPLVGDLGLGWREREQPSRRLERRSRHGRENGRENGRESGRENGRGSGRGCGL